MADLDVTCALSALGKCFYAVLRFPDDPDGPHVYFGACVAVVVPAVGSAVDLQLFVRSGNFMGPTAPVGGYDFELYWEYIVSLFVVD